LVHGPRIEFQSLKGIWWQKALQYVKEETITHVPASLAIPSAVGSVQGTMGLLLTYPGLWWRPPEDFNSSLRNGIGAPIMQ
jgi:hypothetical protein